MKCCLALACVLCSIAICGAACAPDDATLNGTEREDASVQTRDSGLLSDASGAVSTPDAGPTAVPDGSAGLAHDAASAGAVDARAEAAVATDAAPRSDADATSAPDGALDAGTPDASSSGATRPSAGCGKAGRPSGGRGGVAGERNYTFPTSYDGKQPFPLLLGFHAASNPIDQIEKLTNGSELETRFVRAFPKSKGSAWDYDMDIAKVIAMYDDLLANYCIDMSRVFATGHSSGAQLIVQILTPARKAHADHFNLRAVAPVAASRYGTVSRAIPVIYIQGARDNVRNSDGADVVKEFVTANGCTSMTKAATGPVCTSSGKTVNDGCKQYDGCKVPTLWCSHDDPAYSNTSHGWPCFASKAIFDFFAALP